MSLVLSTLLFYSYEPLLFSFQLIIYSTLLYSILFYFALIVSVLSPIPDPIYDSVLLTASRSM